jgi:hypothetical protein
LNKILCNGNIFFTKLQALLFFQTQNHGFCDSSGSKIHSHKVANIAWKHGEIPRECRLKNYSHGFNTNCICHSYHKYIIENHHFTNDLHHYFLSKIIAHRDDVLVAANVCFIHSTMQKIAQFIF